MFLKQKLSKTAKITIVKNYGRLKRGTGGPGARAPPPKYATEHCCFHYRRRSVNVKRCVVWCGVDSSTSGTSSRRSVDAASRPCWQPGRWGRCWVQASSQVEELERWLGEEHKPQDTGKRNTSTGSGHPGRERTGIRGAPCKVNNSPVLYRIVARLHALKSLWQIYFTFFFYRTTLMI